jgi:type II secretory pathway pseudopilin PulG
MKTTESRRNNAFTLPEIIIIVTILVILAAIAIPNYLKSGPAVAARTCISNLRAIDAAKELWTLKFKKNSGTPVVDSEINSLIKSGFPQCPSGGHYNYQTIDTLPTCSVPGHTIN